MINQYVQLQSMLYSFNNSALFLKGRLATPQSLVPQMALALTYLSTEIQSSATAKQWNYCLAVEWMCILCGLEHIGKGLYDVEFMRLHDQRTFYATYTASEWCEHWTRIA